LDELVRKRYQSFDSEIGALIEVCHFTSWEFDFLPSKDGIGLRLKVLTLVYGFKQAGKGDFETLERKVLEWGEPTVPSGKQVNGMTVQASCPHHSHSNNTNSFPPMAHRNLVLS